ncbi:pentapeptide repeat-containing protein [Streptomyces sp. NPDC086077]|uniref:pentapeptide repeat-containing protein n=1 Tax=Streptomyces sp. NPDC086077 TaxID=3154862 RepID=UPI0034219126
MELLTRQIRAAPEQALRKATGLAARRYSGPAGDGCGGSPTARRFPWRAKSVPRGDARRADLLEGLPGNGRPTGGVLTRMASTRAPGDPEWPCCGDGVTGGNRAGCTGRSVDPHPACLAHLSSLDRDTHLASLNPGDDIDYRGTRFTDRLLDQVLNALNDPTTDHPRLGDARFESATFVGNANFELATFTGTAQFGSAAFTGNAWFESATFTREAQFDLVTFTGTAGFESATFNGDARFHTATFTGPAWFLLATFAHAAVFISATFTDAGFRAATFCETVYFHSATFNGDAQFASATFNRGAQFGSATISGEAGFHSATFNGDARFASATFDSNALFHLATFGGIADFGTAAFGGIADFEAASFTEDVDFGAAVFKRAGELGPLVCGKTVYLSGATFDGPVTLSIAARALECHRTRWASTATLRLRHADVNFAHADFEYPLTIAAEQAHFGHSHGTRGAVVPEDGLTYTASSRVRIISLRGVDAAHLVLADTDLTRCLFTRTVHLDQIRLEGNCTFATVPARTQWRQLLPQRFTQRRTLAEEHHWRSRQPAAVPGWQQPVHDTGHTEHVGPAQLAPVYRALRKAFEDSKNEPDAADFYYGEMEMRRHDHSRPRAERALLAAYWALSGYGLRATRAAAWLLLAMTSTLLAMMLWGLPADNWKPETVGSVSGQQVRLPTQKPDPTNPTNAIRERLSTQRFEKSLRVVVNSVIFRSSNQDLTTAGTYTEMASRLSEPVLLGLAALAIRGRIKR